MPSAFDMCVIATSRVRGDSSRSNCVEHQLAAIVDRRDAQRARRSARTRSCHGTMFEWCSIARDQHLVARPQPRPREALRDQIDALGRVAREDDFARVAVR